MASAAARLGAVCPSCGSENAPENRFCGECGTPLSADASPAERAEAPSAVPAAERRLVSVLFADLVGFTSASEKRDAEETRELLSRYFDTCRRLIELYGGTVEKFIGDAVMAVWGTPVATEDDAERAVRAALDLVAAVTALGDEVGAESLRARAGVLTGEAAVTIGAKGEGMVAGDLVNTASRIQSTASPGSVYVGDATRRATEQTVAYESAGSHELQGKEGLFPLFRALRVVSGARGSLKAEGLEAPFVGRDRELRLVKEAFHGVADDRTRAPHLDHRFRRNRQEPSRLGVLQVHRRPAARHLLASRPLSLVRRGRDLLGAGGHGQDALPDRRGRSHGLGTRQAPRGARRAHSRRGRTAVRGAARCPSARPRGRRTLRARRSVRSMADLLRAPERSRTGGDGVRGPAVGG